MTEVFSSIDLRFVAALFFVLVNGFLIGFERGSRGEPAGVRTHTLVMFGAMLFTMISREIMVDPSRIASNVVVGIGFIGAGLIMKHGDHVRGVTTAANLWLTAAIGVAIGFGYYAISILASVAAFIILKLPHIGERRIAKITYLKKPNKVKTKR